MLFISVATTASYAVISPVSTIVSPIVSALAGGTYSESSCFFSWSIVNLTGSLFIVVSPPSS